MRKEDKWQKVELNMSIFLEMGRFPEFLLGLLVDIRLHSKGARDRKDTEDEFSCFQTFGSLSKIIYRSGGKKIPMPCRQDTGFRSAFSGQK